MAEIDAVGAAPPGNRNRSVRQRVVVAVRRRLAPPAWSAAGVALLLGGLTLAGVGYRGVWLDIRLLAGLLAVALFAAAVRRVWPVSGVPTPDHDAIRILAAGSVLTALCLLAMASNWTVHRWFYFLLWSPRRQGWTVPGLGLFLGHALWLAVALARFPRYWRRLAALAILGSMAVTILAFARHTDGGQALYNDDHPTFMYRLWLIGRTFPQLVNYVPQWNAGTVEVNTVLSGAWIPGILFLPLWTFWPVHQVYAPVLGVMYLVLVPLLAALSIRMMGGSWLAALCGAAVAVIPTRYYSLWLLHYGTVGSGFAMALVIPVSALIYRLLEQRNGVAVTLALTGCVVMMGLWPLAPFMTLPFVLAVALHIRTLRWRSGLGLAVMAAATLVCLGAYYRVVLVGGRVVADGGLALGQGIQPAWWRAGATLLRNHVYMGHPILVFMGLAGGLLLLRGRLRTWNTAVLAGFILLAGWGDALVPGRQLYRLGIPMFFAAIPPAMLAVDALLRRVPSFPVALTALLVAVFPATAWNAGYLIRRYGTEQYFGMPTSLVQLGEAIRREQTVPGRVLLTGAIGEDYGGGHLGYLPVFYDREMLANAHAHNQDMDWRAGTPPAEPPADPAVFRNMVDTFAVSLLVARQVAWRDYLRDQTDDYEQCTVIADGDRDFTVFRVRSPTGPFIEGHGLILAEPNKLRIALDQHYDRVRIRYRWADGWSVTPPSALAPYQDHRGVRFIEIQPQGVTDLVLRFDRSRHALRGDL